MNPDKSTILITGGAQRVGAFLCRRFHVLGARVIVHFNRSAAEAEELRKETGCELIQADLADAAQLERFRGVHFDVLINNASLYLPHDGSEEAERLHFKVNAEAPEFLCRLAAELPGGVIINFLDEAVLSPPAPDESSYLRSKRALCGKTLLLAQELAPAWRVNAIAPGPVLPPVFLPESRMTAEISRTLLKKKVDLNDIAMAAEFLIRCDSVTGCLLPVDCGRRFYRSN